jgi:hypothetical protein
VGGGRQEAGSLASLAGRLCIAFYICDTFFGRRRCINEGGRKKKGKDGQNERNKGARKGGEKAEIKQVVIAASIKQLHIS